MLRVIFDTNIYGNLIKEQSFKEIETKLVNHKEFIVYGYVPIRRELRNVPKSSEKSRKLRLALLGLYDKVTKKRILESAESILILAEKYSKEYRNQGGTLRLDASFKVDFQIVALASLHSLDLVCTADQKTLLSKSAIRAYAIINHQEGLRTPEFLQYQELLKLI